MADNKDRGIALDVMTRIVNVHWQSGLAVLFGPEDKDAPKRETIPE